MKKYAIFTVINLTNGPNVYWPLFEFTTEQEMLEWLQRNNEAIALGNTLECYPSHLDGHFKTNPDGTFSPMFPFAYGQEIWK